LYEFLKFVAESAAVSFLVDEDPERMVVVGGFAVLLRKLVIEPLEGGETEALTVPTFLIASADDEGAGVPLQGLLLEIVYGESAFPVVLHVDVALAVHVDIVVFFPFGELFEELFFTAECFTDGDQSGFGYSVNGGIFDHLQKVLVLFGKLLPLGFNLFLRDLYLRLTLLFFHRADTSVVDLNLSATFVLVVASEWWYGSVGGRLRAVCAAITVP